MTGFLHNSSNSNELASLIPQTFLAYSIVINCIPKQIPKSGTLLVRAYSIASIIPAIPRSPNPPGTIIPSASFNLSATFSLFNSSELIKSILTTLFT